MPTSDSEGMILVDLDSGRNMTQAESDMSDLQASGDEWDLAMTSAHGKLTLQALNTHFMHVSETLWDTVTPQDIVGYWRQEHRPPPQSTALRLFTGHPNQYYYYTRKGVMGMLRVTENVNDPNQFRICCKRVACNG